MRAEDDTVAQNIMKYVFMKNERRHIISCFVALISMLAMASCVSDDMPADDGDENDQALFVLHVSTLSTDPMVLNDEGVVEKIKSLRVIAISKGGKDGGEDVIEINRLVKFDNEPSVSDFGEYAFTWRTNPGEKEFYIFANEEEVGTNNNIDFEGEVPNGVASLPSLTALLDYYKATPDSKKFELNSGSAASATTDHNTEAGDGKSSAADFKKVIKALRFEPKYDIVETASAGTAGEEGGSANTLRRGEIFLPYSTCYENVNVAGGTTTNKAMFLVPVATKFYYKFINYRGSDVAIKKIEVNSIDSENFLLGHVSGDDVTKSFKSDDTSEPESLYWVDWLAKVAEATQKNNSLDNGEINDRFGWISNYSLPVTSSRNAVTMFGQADGTVKVDGKKTVASEDIPGELVFGPYYYPESGPTTIGNFTGYFLTLGLLDTGKNDSPEFENVQIGNIKALFRDTHVVIYVRMSEGTVDIYAEMKPWAVSPNYGKVEEL